MIKIKDFSVRTGFSIRMLRYLEEVGVLIPARDSNNYRIYSPGQIDNALWIKKLQNLGFQLKEIELLNNNPSTDLDVLRNVLRREQEIAEIKSESIPVLKAMVDFLSDGNTTIQEYYKNKKPQNTKMTTLGGEEKFHRTAYSIPILKSIYEDHLTIDANVELMKTDLMKFSEWFENCAYLPIVFSVLKESSFVFGKDISQQFIDGYEQSWKKFLPEMGFRKLNDFSKEDVAQLMGPHDIIIRTTFMYKDTNVKGEIVIPYAPIYTMSQLSNKI